MQAEQGVGTDKSNRFLRMFRFRRMIYILIFSVIFFFICLLSADLYIEAYSKEKLYRQVEQVPCRKAALVLGCSPYLRDRRVNLFYKYRIDATAELWKAGKIDAIVVSGDNSRKDYDEPSSMKADLVAKGVPADYITIDYAGFRTLDSVIRADKIFGLDEYIVVSQPFHCQRAIYLGCKKGQSVIGYCATDVEGRSGLKVRLRETVARGKAVLDVLFSTEPRFLGQQETVCYRSAD